jgi:hypothetical protein
MNKYQENYDGYYWVAYFDENDTQYGDAYDCYETLEEAKDAAKHYKTASEEVTFVRASVIDRGGNVLWYTY